MNLAKYFIAGLATCVLLISCNNQDQNQSNVLRQAPYEYAVADSVWEEGLGNHRAVLNVPEPSEAVKVSFEWRRHDNYVDSVMFLVVNAQTGDTIPNIKRISADKERCEFIFGPAKEAGEYYFYYLSFRPQDYALERWDMDYNRLDKQAAPEEKWLADVNGMQDIPEASIVKVESRTEFDSFYPMEIIATQNEVDEFLRANPGRFNLFPEDRQYPIRMKHNVPMRWMQGQDRSTFKGIARPNEYYAFQIGVWASSSLANVTYQVSDLRCGRKVIPAEAFTCFNTNGVDTHGRPFTKKVSVASGDIQPLWFGIDLKENQPKGTYKGTLTISDETGFSVPVNISLKVEGDKLEDRGDGETWKHSRLRWLNSTLGISDKPIKGYSAVKSSGNQIITDEHTMTMDSLTSLPASIKSFGNEILAGPLRFRVITATGEKSFTGKISEAEKEEGHVLETWESEDDELKLSCRIRMEYDGWINYVYTIQPKKDIDIKDVRLEIPIRKEVAKYFIGFGIPGQDTPIYYEADWKNMKKRVSPYPSVVYSSKWNAWLYPYDSFWCGNAEAGIFCKYRGAEYTGPLIAFYKPDPPVSWNNNGKGGFIVERRPDETTVTAYSGERKLAQKDSLTFDFAMNPTPVKKLDVKRKYSEVSKMGQIHHGSEPNPFIDYPFLKPEKLKEVSESSAKNGIKSLLYYTVHELSTHATELWALRSLGNEILSDGPGGEGYMWLREHLVSDYDAAWYEYFKEGLYGVNADAAIQTYRDTRWDNYYLEGVAWLIKNCNINGLYLDNTSLDRDMMKRLRHILDEQGPNCMIDLHSDSWSVRGPVNHYADLFPYIDRVWLGEGFFYNEMESANWFVEVSGIPFGMCSDMIYGGNPWLATQYGMTYRFSSRGHDPKYIWDFWNEFGISDAKMVGFWEDNPAVTTSDFDVKATAFIKDGKTLVSIGNYSVKSKNVRLNIDWEQLGLDPEKVKMSAPAIKEYQDAKEFEVGKPVEIPAKEGWMIVISE